MIKGFRALGVALVLAAVAAPVAQADNNNSRKLRDAVTLEGVKRHLAAFDAIGQLAGGNRFAGTTGHDQSARYVISKLQEAGYTPTVFPFTYNAFYERTPSQLTADGTSYVNGIDFRVLSYSGSGNTTAPLAAPAGDARGCYASDWAGFAAGSVALVSRGTPAGFPGGSCTFRIKVNNAAAAGASAVLVYNNVPGVLNGTLGEGPLSAIPALGLTQALGQHLLGKLGAPATVTTDTASQVLDTYNVLAETAGGDPDNVVMAGAHLDSVAAGPGINDNGSGSGAILETAIQMAKVKPRNKVRFAWWSAEESGLIGATRYVQSLPQGEGDKIAAYLNFDMIGSPNFVRFVYDGDGSADAASIPAGCEERCRTGSGAIEGLFGGYFDSVALPYEPTPFNGRSDYGPFINANIAAGGLFTGAEGIKTPAQAQTYGGTAGVAFDPCYHARCDDLNNLSDEALDQMSDAVAHAVISLAQNSVLVNGLKGKGNFKQPSGGTGGTGSGGGGGLHDDHEDEEA